MPTRGKNCIDNIFINFSVDNFSTQVIGFDFSDHRVRVVSVNIMNNVKSGGNESRYVRPLTQNDFNFFYNILCSVSWDFVRDDSLGIDERFNILNEILIDSFLVSFPSRQIKVNKRDGGIKWFSSELHDIRTRLNLLNDMYERYQTDDLRIACNRLRKYYRTMIKRAKIKANDKVIKNSNNRSRTMWSLINNMRNTPRSDRNTFISPRDFNHYFASVANETIKDYPTKFMILLA